jgi:hypothetical protein
VSMHSLRALCSRSISDVMAATSLRGIMVGVYADVQKSQRRPELMQSHDVDSRAERRESAHGQRGLALCQLNLIRNQGGSCRLRFGPAGKFCDAAHPLSPQGPDRTLRL